MEFVYKRLETQGESREARTGKKCRLRGRRNPSRNALAEPGARRVTGKGRTSADVETMPLCLKSVLPQCRNLTPQDSSQCVSK